MAQQDCSRLHNSLFRQLYHFLHHAAAMASTTRASQQSEAHHQRSLLVPMFSPYSTSHSTNSPSPTRPLTHDRCNTHLKLVLQARPNIPKCAWNSITSYAPLLPIQLQPSPTHPRALHPHPRRQPPKSHLLLLLLLSRGVSPPTPAGQKKKAHE